MKLWGSRGISGVLPATRPGSAPHHAAGPLREATWEQIHDHVLYYASCCKRLCEFYCRGPRERGAGSVTAKLASTHTVARVSGQNEQYIHRLGSYRQASHSFMRPTHFLRRPVIENPAHEVGPFSLPGAAMKSPYRISPLIHNSRSPVSPSNARMLNRSAGARWRPARCPRSVEEQPRFGQSRRSPCR